MNRNLNRNIKRKVNLLGEAAVGKTSLILRFVKNVFGDEYLKTVGTNVYPKKVPVSGSEVKLLMYDIMGESDFKSVQDMAFEKSTGAIAVADCTREETLYKLIDDWLPKYRKSALNNASIILAVNKMDLEDKELTENEVVDNASQYFDSIFFTSAKTGENVEDMFKELGFRTMYRSPTSIKGVEDIVTMHKKIDTPKKLLSGLLAYASKLGEVPYSTMEDILEQSGIDKFSMDEGITEEQALEFGQNLIERYEDNEDTKSTSAITRLLEKYKEDS
ncbi:MAG: GTP-binding protein [Candidatus Thermoplasmatota archaeon]|nr:GTP-binding protein [Candidatus Thermoplasmatota archaeon]